MPVFCFTFCVFDRHCSLQEIAQAETSPKKPSHVRVTFLFCYDYVLHVCTTTGLHTIVFCVSQTRSQSLMDLNEAENTLDARYCRRLKSPGDSTMSSPALTPYSSPRKGASPRKAAASPQKMHDFLFDDAKPKTPQRSPSKCELLFFRK